MSEDTLVCRCYRVRESEIRKAVAGGSLTTVEQVSEATGAAAGCGSCFDEVQALLDTAHGTSRRAAPAEPAMPLGQLRVKVLDAMNRDIIPLFELNGVHVDVLGIEPGRVLARLKGGAVGTTQASILTLKWELVRILSAACNRKMSLIEMNILEEPGAFPPLMKT